jgi:hypothetical protein
MGLPDEQSHRASQAQLEHVKARARPISSFRGDERIHQHALLHVTTAA